MKFNIQMVTENMYKSPKQNARKRRKIPKGYLSKLMSRK